MTAPSRKWHSLVSHTRAEAPYSGFIESTRPTWSDERMDEFATRTQADLREVRGEIRTTRTDLRGEIRDVRTGLEDDIKELRVEMNGRFAGIEQRFNILFGALATGFVGAVVAHFVG